MNHEGSGTACITHDGVILHFGGQDSQGAADVTALSVHFSPNPPAPLTPTVSQKSPCLPARWQPCCNRSSKEAVFF